MHHGAWHLQVLRRSVETTRCSREIWCSLAFGGFVTWHSGCEDPSADWGSRPANAVSSVVVSVGPIYSFRVRRISTAMSVSVLARAAASSAVEIRQPQTSRGLYAQGRGAGMSRPRHLGHIASGPGRCRRRSSFWHGCSRRSSPPRKPRIMRGLRPDRAACGRWTCHVSGWRLRQSPRRLRGDNAPPDRRRGPCAGRCRDFRALDQRGRPCQLSTQTFRKTSTAGSCTAVAAPWQRRSQPQSSPVGTDDGSMFSS